MQKDNKILRLVSIYCYIAAGVLVLAILLSLIPIIPISSNFFNIFYILQELLGLFYLSLLPIGFLHTVIGSVVLYLVMALLYFAAGRGLSNYESWARNLLIILSLISFLIMLYFIVMSTLLSVMGVSIVINIIGWIIQALILYCLSTKLN